MTSLDHTTERRKERIKIMILVRYYKSTGNRRMANVVASYWWYIGRKLDYIQRPFQPFSALR